MIKRPMIWILTAYIFGMFLAKRLLSIHLTMILMLVLCLMIYLLMYRIKNKIINHKDKFLWSLPILLILGFLSMSGQLKKPALYGAFEQEVPCELTGKITMIVEKQWGKALYVTNNVVSLSENSYYLCENVIVFCSGDDKGEEYLNNSYKANYLVGNQITVKGKLQKFSRPSNPGQFNEELYYQIENIDFKLEAEQINITDAGYSEFHRLLGTIKSKLVRVYSSILAEKEAGALIAMLLGEKYLLNEEIKQLYQENGISHLLAISGLHISLIGMFVFRLLRKLKLPIVPATACSIFFIYSYGVLTNFSVSTNRAVVMMTIILLSTLIGKTYDMLSATALSALIILLQNPLQILSAGFLLSFGAVLGIAILLPCLNTLFPTKNLVVNSIFISVSAQAFTTPFVLYFYYQLPTYSTITNLIILPFVTILTLTSILAVIVGVIFMPLGIFLIGGANYILKFYEWICRMGSDIPGNLITVGRPDRLRLLLCFLLIFLFVWVVRRYCKKYSLALLALSMIILILPQRNSGLEITMLDVGQGDAIFMESNNGTTYLIDGGSSDVYKVGVNRLQPFLLYQGTDTIDYAIMTHSDEDHISGLTELMAGKKIKIKNLVLPAIQNKDEAYLELEVLARKQKIKLHYMKVGDIIKDDLLQIYCLHPFANYISTSANAYSTVLSVRYSNFDMLLTGDLEQDGERMVQEILEKEEDNDGLPPEGNYDVLKVAHHGSRNSTAEEFLQLIQPTYSLISCGKDNFYGHPHEELIERLNAVESKVFITTQSGAICIRTDGERMKVGTNAIFRLP